MNSRCILTFSPVLILCAVKGDSGDPFWKSMFCHISRICILSLQLINTFQRMNCFRKSLLLDYLGVVAYVP